MILNDYDRRWAEIEFYQFCVTTYELNHRSLDILDLAETICALGESDWKIIKNIINMMMNDTYYKNNKRDIILTGNVKGIPNSQLAEMIGITRQGVAQYIKRNKNHYTPIPRCEAYQDSELIKFIKTLTKVRTLGTFNYGTTD